MAVFQSTSPARGTTFFADCNSPTSIISIHVPREGDDGADLIPNSSGNISIHVPREGDDPAPAAGRPRRRDFNPRPPRGGRPHPHTVQQLGIAISIHVPREGDDLSNSFCRPSGLEFQSTSPARGTTLHPMLQQKRPGISIHVPREGDDRRGLQSGCCTEYFNPRPPRGGRLIAVSSSASRV